MMQYRADEMSLGLAAPWGQFKAGGSPSQVAGGGTPAPNAAPVGVDNDEKRAVLTAWGSVFVILVVAYLFFTPVEL